MVLEFSLVVVFRFILIQPWIFLVKIDPDPSHEYFLFQKQISNCLF